MNEKALNVVELRNYLYGAYRHNVDFTFSPDVGRCQQEIYAMIGQSAKREFISELCSHMGFDHPDGIICDGKPISANFGDESEDGGINHGITKCKPAE